MSRKRKPQHYHPANDKHLPIDYGLPLRNAEIKPDFRDDPRTMALIERIARYNAT